LPPEDPDTIHDTELDESPDPVAALPVIEPRR
jgi:hypothetical protein